MIKCKIDGQECDFWYGFVRPANRYYWINTSTCHLSGNGYPTHIYHCINIDTNKEMANGTITETKPK